MSEELIVRHCSPTLAGIKTGSLFTYTYSDRTEMTESLRSFNRRLKSKGLCAIPLKHTDHTALIYIFRPSDLARDLEQSDVRELLDKSGYSGLKIHDHIPKLISKLRSSKDFPHEIGLFLGYPPEDVSGFMENSSAAKCTGLWKVYSNEERAKALFRKYKKCTDEFFTQLAKGKTVDNLAVAL